MKKLFLFLSISLLTLSISSCSDDDSSPANNEPGGTVSFKVDGVQKTFNNVIINTEIIEEQEEMNISHLKYLKAK